MITIPDERGNIVASNSQANKLPEHSGFSGCFEFNYIGHEERKFHFLPGPRQEHDSVCIPKYLPNSRKINPGPLLLEYSFELLQSCVCRGTVHSHGHICLLF